MIYAYALSLEDSNAGRVPCISSAHTQVAEQEWKPGLFIFTSYL